jgi:hypothetical protein
VDLGGIMEEPPAGFFSMSRRRKTDSSFKPTPVQAMILHAVESDMDWKHVETLIDVAWSAKSFDASATWDVYGNSMAAAIASAKGGSGHLKHVPTTLLDRILALDPKNLERTNNDGSTAVDLYLDAAAERDSYAYTVLDWWIEHAPRKAFFEWTPRDSYGDIKPFDPAGNHLVKAVLGHEANDSNRHQKETVLPLLFSLGISPNQRDSQGELAFSGMHNPIQWEAFVAAGGDGALVVGGKDDNEDGSHKKRLWNDLVDRRYGEMEKVVRDWAAKHASGDINAKNIADYWELLKDKSKFSVSPGDIIGYLRRHDDFLTLRDADGRNCLTYAIQMHASSWKTLEQKRFSGMLQDVDNNGNTLWYYALLNGKRCTTETVSFLKKNKVPCEVGEDGRGLIAKVLLDPAPGFSSWERLASGPEVGKKIGAALDSEALWAVPADKSAELFEKIFNYASNTNRSLTAEALLELGNAHAHALQDPYVLGAVAALNLKSYKGDKDLARECIDRGGLFALSEEDLEAFKSSISDVALLQSLEATMQRLALRKNADSVERTRSGPRL